VCCPRVAEHPSCGRKIWLPARAALGSAAVQTAGKQHTAGCCVEEGSRSSHSSHGHPPAPSTASTPAEEGSELLSRPRAAQELARRDSRLSTNGFLPFWMETLCPNVSQQTAQTASVLDHRGEKCSSEDVIQGIPKQRPLMIYLNSDQQLNIIL